MIDTKIAALYCDGGVIERNPSLHGGTWCWIAVNEAGEEVVRDSGLLPGPCTNNLSEFVAAVRALETVPPGWEGKLYSDSQVTLGRLFRQWSLNGLPLIWIARGSNVLGQVGYVEPVLLQGHPTREELAAGVGKRHGFPVSNWNVKCDRECSRLAAEFMAGRIAA